MAFLIYKVGVSDLNQLPSAHTCFNNLILPDYKNKELMKKKIHIAIHYSEGFGKVYRDFQILQGYT